MNELTEQPYCGPFLMYLLFEETSQVHDGMIQKCLSTVNDFDLIQFMNFEEIDDAEEYFDMNRQLQLREKF